MSLAKGSTAIPSIQTLETLVENTGRTLSAFREAASIALPVLTRKHRPGTTTVARLGICED